MGVAFKPTDARFGLEESELCGGSTVNAVDIDNDDEMNPTAAVT